MATEYKLSYTASDIDKRLGKIDDMVLTVNGIAPDNNGNVSIETGSVSSGGMSSTAKNLLISILRNAVYNSNQSTNITALEEALASSGSGDSGGSSGGSDSGEVETKTYTITKNLTNVTSSNSTTVVNEGDSYSCSFQSKDGYLIKSVLVTMGGGIEESQTYEGTAMYMWSTSSVTGNIVITIVADVASGDSGETATLSSISATYSGGDVTVGTSVSSLNGVVVNAHYSDGTIKAVTGYTLSGTIAEGNNTITVSYGGKTTTFSVTGVAESGGEEEPGDSTAEIPADATRLAYIESTGTQYIDTGYQPAADDVAELTMETSYAGTTARVEWYGAFDGTNYFRLGTNLNYVYHGKGNQCISAPTYNELFGESTTPIKFNVKQTLCIPIDRPYLSSRIDFYDMDGNRITCIILGKSSVTVNSPVAANVYLFAFNNNGTLERHSSMKLYECIFYGVNDTEVHHYVPVKDGDGVVCLYDTIDKKYLYNAGTGDFIGGELV